MKKTIVMGVLAFSLFCLSGYAAADQVHVQVNGKNVTFEDVQPYIDNDRTMVLDHFVAEELGAQVGWDQANKRVSIHYKNNVIQLVAGQATATVDGKVVTFDAPAQVKDDHTLVPLRFISENMGAKVAWDQKLYLAMINTDGSTPIPAPLPNDQESSNTTPQVGVNGVTEVIGNVGIVSDAKSVDSTATVVNKPEESAKALPVVQAFGKTVERNGTKLSMKGVEVPSGYRSEVRAFWLDDSGKVTSTIITVLAAGQPFSVDTQGKNMKLNFSVVASDASLANGLTLYTKDMRGYYRTR